MRLHAPMAFLPGGWAPDVLIEIGPGGIILRVVPGSDAAGAQRLPGPVLPGMPNLHAHAFQRMIAGHAERGTRGPDDFWSWRAAMFAAAATLDPDTLFAIARDVYTRMLRAGYTAVAEFQYLHRDPSGAWYTDRAAMSRALIEAARAAGIAICLLPALYTQGDAGGVPLDAARRRFRCDVDDVLAIAADLRAVYADDSDVVIGVCAHSLRAVTPAQLRALIDGSPSDVPVHLHIAEQTREVEAVVAALGARPVAWLLDQHAVDERWCLVHATQLDEGEIVALARTGAIAGICPTTEANLGDGLFPLEPYLAAGGALGIGSDSMAAIAPTEELRWLEYGQRLALRRRIVAARPGESCGERLWSATASGGARACGRRAGAIAEGLRADLLVLEGSDDDDPSTVIDRWIFAADRGAPHAVFVGGRQREG